MKPAEAIYITDKDYEVLDSIANRYPQGNQLELLEEELTRAQVVPEDEIPDNVITLYSKAQILDQTAARERSLTLVPPHESSGGEDRVSVLAPLGAAVIGLSEGQVIEWPLPSGKSRRFKVTKVLYQPEAQRRKLRSVPPPEERKIDEAASRVEEIDTIDQASIESFPASDAPGWRL